jgi:hypothetical protein
MDSQDWAHLINRLPRLSEIVQSSPSREVGAQNLRNRILTMGVQITPTMAEEVYDKVRSSK